MQRSVTYQARDLPPDKRRAAEVLLGEPLRGDELITVRASQVELLTQGLNADARERVFGALFESIDRAAQRVGDEREESIDAAIDEAVEYVRHHRD